MGKLGVQMKDSLKEYSLSTTFHAMPNIMRSERLFFKIMWMFCLLGSSLYCLVMVVRSITSFLDHKVMINIEIIEENSVEFPAVTFCNLNQFASDNALEKLSQFKKNNPEYLNASNMSIGKQVFDIKNSFHSYSMSQNLTDAYRRNYSLPLEDIIIECQIGISKCTADDFYWFYDSIYGNCFTFNKGKNSKGESKNIAKMYNKGSLTGLRLQLYVGNQSKTDEIIQSSGIHVNVHNRTNEPIAEEGVDASSGEETKIAINRVFHYKLPAPFSDCLPKSNETDGSYSEFYRAIIQSNKTYTQSECLQICSENTDKMFQPKDLQRCVVLCPLE